MTQNEKLIELLNFRAEYHILGSMLGVSPRHVTTLRKSGMLPQNGASYLESIKFYNESLRAQAAGKTTDLTKARLIAEISGLEANASNRWLDYLKTREQLIDVVEMSEIFSLAMGQLHGQILALGARFPDMKAAVDSVLATCEQMGKEMQDTAEEAMAKEIAEIQLASKVIAQQDELEEGKHIAAAAVQEAEKAQALMQAQGAGNA